MKNPKLRLEQCLYIPLGTVLNDKEGVPHVFVGTVTNSLGIVFYFQPPPSTGWLHSTYSHWERASSKFPDLKKYLLPEFKDEPQL